MTFLLTVSRGITFQEVQEVLSDMLLFNKRSFLCLAEVRLRLHGPTYFLPRISLIFFNMMRIRVFPLHKKKHKGLSSSYFFQY